MPYLSCKKIENDVYNFPTWQYCKYKDIFDSRIIINSTAKFYISISYQKDLLSIDTRIFTPSFLLGGSPALCPNGIEIGHVFDAILYKRSSFPGIPFGMPYFRLFCFQLSKSMPFLMEKDNFPFFRSESCNEAY